MRVLNIIQDSIVDGPGLRSTIFFAGCPHKCRGCHNPQSWNVVGGKELKTMEIFDLLMKNTLNDITFSGGEPFYQCHDELLTLASALKERGKNIWCYTGYTWEELISRQSSKAICKLIDVVVDGPFVAEKRDLTLSFMGSRNQRLIDCSRSLLEKKTVLYII